MSKRQQKKQSKSQSIKKILDNNILSDIFTECIISEVESCKDKHAYESEWQAKFAADEQKQFHKIFLTWYKCNVCGKWHLTKSKNLF